MFGMTPPFWMQPSTASGITPGSPTPFAFGANNTAAAQIDSTRVLLLYQRSSTPFAAYAVIVTDAGGGAVSWGTPVQVSSATGAVIVKGLSVLDAGAGTYACFYNGFVGGSFSYRSRIIAVTGSTITVTGTEDFIADDTTTGFPIAIVGGNVISPTILAGTVQTGNGLYVLIGAVSGATTTWGAPTLTEMGGVYSANTVTGNGGVVIYGPKFGLADQRVWAASVSAGGSATPAYLTSTVADRIHTPTSGAVPTTGAQISTGLHALMAVTSAGGLYCTRAQFSGGVATYSNSDANPNLLAGGPYTAPTGASESGGTLLASPSTSKLVLSFKRGTAWWGALMGVSGNINMAANVIELTANGASGSRPGIAFFTETRFAMFHTDNGLLRGQVCQIS